MKTCQVFTVEYASNIMDHSRSTFYVSILATHAYAHEQCLPVTVVQDTRPGEDFKRPRRPYYSPACLVTSGFVYIVFSADGMHFYSNIMVPAYETCLTENGIPPEPNHKPVPPSLEEIGKPTRFLTVPVDHCKICLVGV